MHHPADRTACRVDELAHAQQQRDRATAELDRHRDRVTVLADYRRPRPGSDNTSTYS